MAVDDFPPYPLETAPERQAAAVELVAQYIAASRQKPELPLLSWTITAGGAVVGECLCKDARDQAQAFDVWSAYLGGERDDSTSAARTVRYVGEGDLRFAVVLVARGYAVPDAAAA